jgi:carbamoylphosphate synthase large subunit
MKMTPADRKKFKQVLADLDRPVPKKRDDRHWRERRVEKIQNRDFPVVRSVIPIPTGP